MSDLRVRLLGALSIAAGNGVEIAFARKHKLLLAALALAGPEGFSRERLMTLLWQDRSEEQARASLRQALAATGKSLGPYRHCLCVELDRVAINSPVVEVDAHKFETLASSDVREDRDRALALYAGDLLDGVRLKEELLEGWLRPRRERLRAKAIALLEQELEVTGSGTQLVDLASRLLELEPTNEAARRALMRAYTSQGRDAAALKQFIVCRELLSNELGIGPSRETIALYNEIRRRRFPVRENREAGESLVIAPVARPEQRSRPMTKPTITVAPFEILSDDPGQDYFAAAITRDIVSALLRHRWLTVIGVTNMLDTGRYSMIDGDRIIESNVDYLVTGSIRRAGDRLRINVQMIDANSNEHIWSENYGRQLGDIFEIQDQITGMIASHIDVEISANERRRVLRKSTQNMDAWHCYHLGMAHFSRFSRDTLREAQRLFARCQELDPEFGEGYAWWSYMSVLSTFYFDAEPTGELFKRALQAAKRAVEIDDQNAVFHLLVSRVYLAQREYAEALAEMGTAMDLNPNLAAIYCGMGDALNYEGEYGKAISQFEKCLQLGPRDPLRWAYSGYKALTHFFAEDFENAIDSSEWAIRHPRCQYWAYAHRVAALGQIGKGEDAVSATAELLRQQPMFSRRLAEEKLYFIKRPEQLRLYLDGLRKAGVPD